MLSNLQKRFLAFLVGCIGLRSLFVVAVKKIPVKYLPYLGLLALIPIIGWLNILFFNPRTKGPETFGAKIWWGPIRPIHVINYTIFAILAFKKNKYAYVPLLADVILGLVAFLVYHYSVGDFKKVLN